MKNKMKMTIKMENLVFMQSVAAVLAIPTDNKF